MADLEIPSAYRPGYERARRINPALARLYIEHTTIGDPTADALMETLAGLDPAEENRLIMACMHGDERVLAQAPAALVDFFEEAKQPPPWFDPQRYDAGQRAFHTHSDLFIPAFFLVTVLNATSLIAQSFYATGRVVSGFGLRRIRQNVRHFVEIMLPGALVDQGDGWRLSVRIRLVHARLRKLISENKKKVGGGGGSWDEPAWGTPIHAANMGLAAANFSAIQLLFARKLGAVMGRETRDSFMQIWRYASYLVGVPEALLFEGDEKKTLEFQRIACACEPPPSKESKIITNALMQALPEIAGKLHPADQEKMVKHAYRVARAVLGHKLSDQLSFPRYNTTGFLQTLRLVRQAYGLSHRVAPDFADKWRGQNFVFLMEASMLDDIRYQLPDQVRVEESVEY